MDNRIRITILVDNSAAPGLKSEHGFSAWIKAFGINILFDTGQGLALAGNAAKLGIHLDQTSHLVLSHGHYDHGGGIPMVTEQAGKAVLHLHPGAVIPRYALDRDGQVRSIGLPRKTLACLADLPDIQVCWVSKPTMLAPGIGLTGTIPRICHFENTGGEFYTDPEAKNEDPLWDDQALWINAPDGLIVVSGCAHSGIINTLTYIQKITSRQKIAAVVGGLHLLNANQPRLDLTLSLLRKISPKIIAPGHCTGTRAITMIRQKFCSAFLSCRVGSTFTLST
ncbi:MBL fold metallo-hydrolase [Desulfonatronovibrio hydrogenovorans]|uniref:MBL fold metallo-hydrolase n=1 Tax=Desulfonatronovibrio hydrogenovorans TaxID=53245 RepID=UPI00048DC1BD|nr:MBL fold metallo-hydrolase [Desulfonatronovibrio hydrogenovorans]